MARYPGAVWRPTRKTGDYGRMRRHDGAVLHVSASATARSLWGWWQNPGSRDDGSHFHVAYDGTVEQYEDTDYIAWTSRVGSLRTIGIETQGGASGKWTTAQVAAIVKLLIWICETHGIPKRDMLNSRPSSRGIGTHRYGIWPWRVSGGEVWSGPGKVCPGNGRQKQLPAIVRAVAGGDVPGVTTPRPSGGTTGGTTRRRRKGPSGQGTSSTKGIQRVLRRTGHYAGLIDGDYGPLTVAAVRAYQSDQNRYGGAGLLVDGDWGSVTRGWLIWVKRLQRALPKFKGVEKLRVDGDYGAVTHAAVRTLQARNDLYVDGIAGPKTTEFMRRAGAQIPNRP